jgi:hypothetical protein
MAKAKPRPRDPRHRLMIDLPADLARALRLQAAEQTGPGHRVTPSTIIHEAIRQFVVVPNARWARTSE